jgi:hypothetical protein
MQSHARLPTDKAARYMTQLAKHWSHKFEVSFDETTALHPAAASGTCRMIADETGLDITVEAADLEGWPGWRTWSPSTCCASPSAKTSRSWPGPAPGKPAQLIRRPCGWGFRRPD